MTALGRVSALVLSCANAVSLNSPMISGANSVAPTENSITPAPLSQRSIRRPGGSLSFERRSRRSKADAIQEVTPVPPPRSDLPPPPRPPPRRISKSPLRSVLVNRQEKLARPVDKERAGRRISWAPDTQDYTADTRRGIFRHRRRKKRDKSGKRRSKSKAVEELNKKMSEESAAAEEDDDWMDLTDLINQINAEEAAKKDEAKDAELAKVAVEAPATVEPSQPIHQDHFASAKTDGTGGTEETTKVEVEVSGASADTASDASTAAPSVSGSSASESSSTTTSESDSGSAAQSSPEEEFPEAGAVTEEEQAAIREAATSQLAASAGDAAVAESASGGAAAPHDVELAVDFTERASSPGSEAVQAARAAAVAVAKSVRNVAKKPVETFRRKGRAQRKAPGKGESKSDSADYDSDDALEGTLDTSKGEREMDAIDMAIEASGKFMDMVLNQETRTKMIKDIADKRFQLTTLDPMNAKDSATLETVLDEAETMLARMSEDARMSHDDQEALAEVEMSQELARKLSAELDREQEREQKEAATGDELAVDRSLERTDSEELSAGEMGYDVVEGVIPEAGTKEGTVSPTAADWCVVGISAQSALSMPTDSNGKNRKASKERVGSNEADVAPHGTVKLGSEDAQTATDIFLSPECFIQMQNMLKRKEEALGRMKKLEQSVPGIDIHIGSYAVADEGDGWVDMQPVDEILRRMYLLYQSSDEEREKIKKWDAFLRGTPTEDDEESDFSDEELEPSPDTKAPRILRKKRTMQEIGEIYDDRRHPEHAKLKQLIYEGLCHPARMMLWPIFLLTKRADRFPKDYLQAIENTVVEYEEGLLQDVEKDVPRTAGLDVEDPKDVIEMNKLQRTLTLYGKFNHHVRYCQGMNFICYNLQSLGMSQKDVFWGLHSLIQNYCAGGRISQKIHPDGPNYRWWYHAGKIKADDGGIIIKDGLAGFQRDMVALDIFVRKVHPDLHACLELLRESLGIFNYILPAAGLTLYSRDLQWPRGELMQLWDVLLYEGPKALFAGFWVTINHYAPQFMKMANDGGMDFQVLPTLKAIPDDMTPRDFIAAIRDALDPNVGIPVYHPTPKSNSMWNSITSVFAPRQKGRVYINSELIRRLRFHADNKIAADEKILEEQGKSNAWSVGARV